MAYGVKYRVEYKDCAGVDKKHDIEVLDYAGAVTDCAACDDPFIIELPEPTPTIHMPVYSTGATLNAESAANLMFKSLYSLDPQRVRLRSYANGSSVPYFCGYLNAEVFGEPYAYASNYDVSLYFNDGFATLERYKYLDGSGNKYTGLVTFWTILSRILTKLALPFEFLYFACKHVEGQITVGASETIFHQLSADQANYYDENDEPMKFLDVLNAILSPFGLQIRWYCGSFLICEPQMLAGASISAKKFNSSFTYVSTATITHNFDISNNDIKWDGADQVLDIASGFSKQNVRYSPYMTEGAVKKIDIANRYLWTGTETWTADAYGILRLSGISAIAGVTLHSGSIHISGKKKATNDTEEIYFERQSWAGGYDTQWLTIDGFEVGKVTGQFLKIQGEVFIRTKNDEYDYEESSVVASRIEIPVQVEIDGKGIHFNPDIMVVLGWEFIVGYDGVVDFKTAVFKNADEATICDRWVEFAAYVPWNLPGGKALLKIWDPDVFVNPTGGSRLTSGDGLKNYRYRNLTVQAFEGGVASGNGSMESASGAPEAVTDDMVYKGELNAAFMNEAPEITLYHADARNITDRGAIRRADKSYTSTWWKTGDISSFRLADLLLRAIHSQYQDSLTQLTGTVEADALMQSNGGPTFLFTIQDTDNLGAIKLMFTGGEYNDFKRTLNGVFLEVKAEDLSLNIL